MRRTLLVGFALMVAACGDSTGPTAIVGRWELTAIEGQTLPVTLLPASGGGCSLDIQSGELTLKDGGTYTASRQFGQLFQGGLFCPSSQIEWGTYTTTGQTITLRLYTGFTYQVQIEQGTLSHSVDGKRYVYHPTTM